MICEIKYAIFVLERAELAEKYPNGHSLICPKLGRFGSIKMRKKESKSQNNNKNTYFLKIEVFSWKNVKFSDKWSRKDETI